MPLNPVFSGREITFEFLEISKECDGNVLKEYFLRCTSSYPDVNGIKTANITNRQQIQFAEFLRDRSETYP